MRKTKAEEVADFFEHDGSRFFLDTRFRGTNIVEVARHHGAMIRNGNGNNEGRTSLTFRDGSAIVIVGGAWDLKHPDCTCGFCWVGGGVHELNCVGTTNA